MYDAIVIGLGGMGSATLFHLARSGCKALGVERFGIPHAFGSSHGSTRIIRLAYSEGSHYVPLLREAYRNWRELERVSRRSILHVTGGLDIGPEDSWTILGSKRSCLRHGLEFKELEAEQVNRRYPGYRLPPSLRALYQPDAGYLLSEVAVASHVDAALDLGAEVIQGTRALGWARQAGSLRVDTEAGRFLAKRLVLATGPWVGQLAPVLRQYCRPERQVMLWTSPVVAAAYAPRRFPVFNMESPRGRFYGYPDHRGEGFKIGKYHHLREQVDDPDAMVHTCDADDERVLRDGLDEYFPQASGPTRRMAACTFTNTPDRDFILDRHPEEPDVFVAAGFSGHGFKFCSAVGRIMADLCLSRSNALDTSRFELRPDRIKRFERLASE